MLAQETRFSNASASEKKSTDKHMELSFKTVAISLVMFAFGMLVLFGTAGCDREYVPVHTYASTNTPPSRFKVVSSDYYNMGYPAENFSTTVLTDTYGTNDILVVDSQNGLAMMYIPKPVKQLEENK